VVLRVRQTLERAAPWRLVDLYEARHAQPVFGLALLPPYLQQLEMESLGKSVTQKGKALRTGSGTVVWGGLGINAQHAYMHSLQQVTQLVPVDFIATCLPR
jgi:glucose-6-phosphate isomerase